jgi:NADH-quinone oxidoreductase subunit M
MLWMYQRVFFGPLSNPENKDLPDLNRRELLYLVPIVVLCFWIGLYPRPFFRILEKPVDYVVSKVDPDYVRNAATTIVAPAAGQLAEIED